MKSFLKYYKYPQYHWSEVVQDALSGLDIAGLEFVDAACGNGIISYWLSRKYPNNTFHLVDLSETSVATARENIGQGNARFYIDNIYHFLDNFEKESVFLLINSLYLLEDAEKLVERVSRSSRYFVGVFPYVDRVNFKTFERKRPSITHPSKMSREETVSLFSSVGYELIRDVELSPFHHHKIPKVPYVTETVMKLLNLVEPNTATPGRGDYWIGVFRKNG